MEKAWTAKWITAPEFNGLTPLNVFYKQQDGHGLPPHRKDLLNHHMLVRRSFWIGVPLTSAHIDISADDYYKLYINGRYVGQGPAPAYHFRYNYNRFDIAEYLQPGENLIAVHVYYQGLINRVWNSGDYRQGMIAEVFINDKTQLENDTRRLQLCTDGSWRQIRAREFTGIDAFGYQTQFVEDIDQRLKETGWYLPGYNDSHWGFCRESPGDDHSLTLQSTPPVQVYEIKPVDIGKTEDGGWLLDFGKEATGCFGMVAEGAAGDVITVMYGEELTESGRHVRHQLRCSCNYRDAWILSGNHDIYEPFDYKAFRYVEITGRVDTVREDSLHAVVRHYPLTETRCSFHSSSPMLNAIWDICENGVICGAQEGLLDCPSREKGQYLGDITISSHAHLYISGDLRLFRKALGDFAASAFVCPGLMAVAPGSHMQEIADFSLQWPLQLLNYYRHSGDAELLREMLPTALGILQYFAQYKREDGLLENVKDKWNLVDWPDNFRDGYDFDLAQPAVGEGCHNIINAFYCGAVKAVNEICDALGESRPLELEPLRQAYIKAFYLPDIRLFSDSAESGHTALHSNIMPLYFNLQPAEATGSIVELIRRKRLNCGVYMSYFLLKGLTNAGEYPLIYELLTSDEEHSWGNMVREGATSCFESWGREQKWNTSLCHPWAGAPIPILVEDIIGLRPGKPGWREICFNPHIPGELDYFELTVHTLAGRIRILHQRGETEISNT